MSDKISMQLVAINSTLESGSLKNGKLTVPVNVTSTLEKNNAIKTLLRSYATVTEFTIKDPSRANARLGATQKTSKPIREVLELGNEYTYNGVRYNTIKQNNTRFEAMIDGTLHTVVLANGYYLTMIQSSLLTPK
jgi:hypothetical protein